MRRIHPFFRGTDSLDEPSRPRESTLSSDVNYVNNEKNHSNSAYVRIKLFKKTVVAKMLIDSGNLVSDLVSEEFAKLARFQYEPVQRKIGTAAKGGSVSIIGKCKPFKVFVENMPDAVIIQPYVVRDLAHPINVGRSFLGRYQGKLEFLQNAGFLEVGGHKTRLIS